MSETGCCKSFPEGPRAVLHQICDDCAYARIDLECLELVDGTIF